MEIIEVMMIIFLEERRKSAITVDRQGRNMSWLPTKFKPENSPNCLTCSIKSSHVL
jgi:hypothetical protein